MFCHKIIPVVFIELSHDEIQCSMWGAIDTLTFIYLMYLFDQFPNMDVTAKYVLDGMLP